MKRYPLDSVALVLKNNVQKFMKGMASNTLDQPLNAFVDLAGKIIATFPIQEISADEYLCVVARDVLDEVMTHVQKYGRLSKTMASPLDSYVYFEMDGAESVSDAEGDYRLAYGDGVMLVSEAALETTATEDEFNRFRLKHHIPLHTIDYHNEMLLNVSEESFVSFDKGCFLGQEVLARVHYKAKPPRKLSVANVSDCNEKEQGRMTSVVKDLDTGESKGFIFVKNI